MYQTTGKNYSSHNRPGDLDDRDPVGDDRDPIGDDLDAVGEAFCVSTAISLKPMIVGPAFSGTIASYDWCCQICLARETASVCFAISPTAQATTMRPPTAPAVMAAPLQTPAKVFRISFVMMYKT